MGLFISDLSKMELKKVNDKYITCYDTDLLISVECCDNLFNKLTYPLRKNKNIKIVLKNKSKDLHKSITFKSTIPKPLSDFMQAKEMLINVFKNKRSLKDYLIERKSLINVTRNVTVSNIMKKSKKNKKSSTKTSTNKQLSENLGIQIFNKPIIPEVSMDDASIMELDPTKPEEIIDLTKTNDIIDIIDLTYSKNKNQIPKNTKTNQQDIASPTKESPDLIDLTQSFIETPKIPSNKSNIRKQNRKIRNNDLSPTISFTESPQINTASMNIFNPNRNTKKEGLRPVIIDGSNVALGHSNGKHFSWKGIEICITYFKKLGHQVMAFVPRYRQFSSNGAFKDLVDKLVDRKELVLTPSRCVDGKPLTPYDDRFIVQSAVELGGVIVSTDNFRDLMDENPTWKETITNRLLMFTWVGDILMFPQDPLGRYGPKLDEFLKFP